jgi:PAS domain S-box-containing protein
MLNIQSPMINAMDHLDFDLLFYAIPTASLLCDAMGNILKANEAAENLLGMGVAKLKKFSVVSLIKHTDTLTSGRHLLSKNKSFQASISKDGKAQHVKVQLTPLQSQDSPMILISIFNDRRSQAECALLNNLRHLPNQAEALNAQSKLAALTEREREVMALAVTGYHNKEIARVLGISHRTVEIHKSKIMHKTGAASLLNLARIADAASQSDIANAG